MRCSARITLGSLAAAVALLAGAPAIAQADPTKVEANRKLAEARKLYEAGDFEGALRKLKLAYDIIPSPKIQFSLGQAYRGLGRYVEALDAYNKFLVEAKDADPALRAEATQYMKDLKQQVSYLEITCDTVGADVAIDGVSYGVTPMPGPIVVTPGPHQVVVRRPGITTAFVEKVDPRRASVVHLNARLTEQPVPAPTAVPPPTPVSPALPPTVAAPGDQLPIAAVAQTRAPAGIQADGWWRRHRWTVVAGSSTVALATAAAVTGLLVQSRFDSLDKTCGSKSATRPGCAERDISALGTRETIANTLWALGGAAAIATGIFFFAEGRDGRAVTVAPAASESTVGFVGHVTF